MLGTARSGAGFGFVPARQVEVFRVSRLDPATETFLLRKPDHELAHHGHDGAGGGLAQRHSGRAFRLL
jgi:hypothetical protein